MIEDAIRTTLANDAAVSADVSARIYPVAMPQKASLPAIVIERVDTEEFTAMNKPAKTLTRARISVVSLAATYSAAKSLANNVWKALTHFSGTVGTDEVKGVVRLSESDDPVPRGDGTDKYLHRVTQDYAVFFLEPTT